jgi:CRISPR/Cas system-associated endoribonuclease Cas2
LVHASSSILKLNHRETGGFIMKKHLSKTIFFLLALGLAMPAFARVSLHDMGQNQMRRIQQGIYSGELTRGEARVLRREQRNIRQLKRRFLRDGRLSRGERRALRHRYTKASRHIYRLKHNHRTRYAYGYHRYSPWGNGGHGVFGLLFH